MTAGPAQRYRPLGTAALALLALPFALQALGLSLNTGIAVVVLAIAAMGLNLCIGYTGLVSFGHSTWFGVGAYAAGLIQLRYFPGEIYETVIPRNVRLSEAPSHGKPVMLHDLRSGTVAATLPVQDPVWRVAMSGDGRIVIVATQHRMTFWSRPPSP